MTPDEILKFVQGAARLWQVRSAIGHATDRMSERKVQLRDIREAILTATDASKSDDGPNRWILSGGRDLDGETLVVVIKLEASVAWVVTVF